MILHAATHRERGFPLPVRWIGVTDTHQAHRLKTCRTLEDPAWHGRWILTDDKHVATYVVAGIELVRLDLFGVEDAGAMDRLRMETTGVWFEEAAPSSVLLTSAGISEAAWGLALTSQRVPSHCKPAMITTNYPDEDHWTWTRFVVRKHPGTAYFRIPPGEYASAEDRAEWARALEGLPDQHRRLLAGEPGALALGPQVAMGFREALHVADHPLVAVPAAPLALGWDFGHTPVCIIAQEARGQICGLAALHSANAGTRQHIESVVRPWLAQHTPWAIQDPGHYLQHFIDPSGAVGDQADIDVSPRRTIEDLLGGSVTAGPVRWPERRDPLLAVLGRLVDGKAALFLDAVACRPLIQALASRWYYPQTASGELRADMPKKPNHPWEDLGDALCYLVAGLVGGPPAPAGPPRVVLAMDPFDLEGPKVLTAVEAW